MFEILVAAACAAMGRHVEFIREGPDLSPDIRCFDPFPPVIECKRKRVLSDYEIAEERVMKTLFLRLAQKCSEIGFCVVFDLELSEESRTAPVDEIVDALVRQRFAPHPERPTEYGWGRVLLQELPLRGGIRATRTYSPFMLKSVFDWDVELPSADGLLCSISHEGSWWVDEVRNPLGLRWKITHETAVRRRSWSPLDSYGNAVNQIPPGEFAIIYVAYQEGTRTEISDARLRAFTERLQD